MDYTRLDIRIKVFWKFIKDYFVNAKFDVGKYLHVSPFKQLNSFTLNVKGNQFSKWHKAWLSLFPNIVDSNYKVIFRITEFFKKIQCLSTKESLLKYFIVVI